MNKKIKKIIENNTFKKKKVSTNILPNQKELSIENEIWIKSIESLKSKKYSKLSDAIDELVNQVISRLNLNTKDDKLKLFLHDMCTDNISILEVIESELMKKL